MSTDIERCIAKHILTLQSMSQLYITKFSKIYTIVDTTGDKFVIKVFQTNLLLRGGEPQLLSKLKHPNIIQLIEYWEDQLYYYLRLPLAHCDLYHYLEQQQLLFNEQQARIVFSQIVNAVAYTHGQKICHRDIKLENILVFDMGQRFVLCDFAFARDFSSGKLIKECCGSYHYLSPELVTDQYYLGPEIDMWAMGVVLYTILTQQLPFVYSKKNKSAYINKVTCGAYYMPRYFSVELQDLIKGLLCADADVRLDITEVRKHPWMKI